MRTGGGGGGYTFGTSNTNRHPGTDAFSYTTLCVRLRTNVVKTQQTFELPYVLCFVNCSGQALAKWMQWHVMDNFHGEVRGSQMSKVKGHFCLANQHTILNNHKEPEFKGPDNSPTILPFLEKNSG